MNIVLIVAVYITMTRDVLLNWQPLVIALLSGILFYQMQKNQDKLKITRNPPFRFLPLFGKKSSFPLFSETKTHNQLKFNVLNKKRKVLVKGL